MIRAGLGFAVPMLFLPTALLGQQTAFEGIATNAITHEPLAGVHLRLIGIRNLPSGPFEMYGGVSDKAGHFSIAPIPPGSYLFMPSLRGFLYAQKKDGPMPFPSLLLKAGERRTDFKLEMTPEGVIAGRVVDEYGDPLPNVQVEIEPISNEFVTATSNMMNVVPFTQVDDRAAFRAACLPGKYLVKASPTSTSSGPLEIRTDGSTPVEYVTTYFPSAPGKDGAATVEVRAGAETAGIEIHMGHTARQGPGLTISGTVSDLPEGNTAAFIVIQSGESAQRITNSRTVQVRPDHRFTFTGERPGYHRLWVTDSPGGNAVQGPPVEVTLANSDVTNVELHLAGSGDLSGTLEFAGEPRAPQEKRTVRLRSTGNMPFGATLSAEVDRDGVFHFAAVPPGKFEVQLDPLPENGYINTMEVDGVAGAGDTVELRGAKGAHARIVLSRNGAALSGKVRYKDGTVVSNTVALVILVQDIEKLSLNEPDDRHSAMVTPEGSYSLHGIRPGKYRLLAVDALHAPRNIEKPEDAKKFLLKLEEFEIKDGDRITKDVMVIESEDGDGKDK